MTPSPRFFTPLTKRTNDDDWWWWWVTNHRTILLSNRESWSLSYQMIARTVPTRRPIAWRCLIQT
jgi:hypothetical protein